MMVNDTENALLLIKGILYIHILFQARKKIISLQTELIIERVSSASISNDDMLDCLLKNDL